MPDIPPTEITEFFAVTLLGGVVLALARILRSDGRRSVARHALPLVAFVAVGATLGSLYFSEVADFVPCDMCWFQRIAMYPIAVVASIAAFRRDRAVLPYLAVLAALGFAASTYHIGIQQFPEQATFCDVSNPCSSRWVEAFGWMTIPQMAAISFALAFSFAFAGATTTKEVSA